MFSYLVSMRIVLQLLIWQPCIRSREPSVSNQMLQNKLIVNRAGLYAERSSIAVRRYMFLTAFRLAYQTLSPFRKQSNGIPHPLLACSLCLGYSPSRCVLLLIPCKTYCYIVAQDNIIKLRSLCAEDDALWS